MSEYQYYYFEAIDEPLTEQQRKELRAISTRAEINSRRFVNEYHYGDFKGKPLELMKKYFDAHIYYACWATRVLMLKVPAKCIDMKLAKEYCTKHTFKIVESGDDLIFCFNIWVDAGDGWWDEDDETHQLISLRDDILNGDYRCLYLAWLARQHDSNGYKEDAGNPPPVPTGLRRLTSSLKMFAKFMFLGDADLDEAATLSADDTLKPLTTKELKDWIVALPDKVKDNTLLSLLEGKETPQTVHRSLLNRFLSDRKKTQRTKTETHQPTKKTCRKKSLKK